MFVDMIVFLRKLTPRPGFSHFDVEFPRQRHFQDSPMEIHSTSTPRGNSARRGTNAPLLDFAGPFLETSVVLKKTGRTSILVVEINRLWPNCMLGLHS